MSRPFVRFANGVRAVVALDLLIVALLCPWQLTLLWAAGAGTLMFAMHKLDQAGELDI